MRRIGFLFCLLLAACDGASPPSPSSPVAGITARPTAAPTLAPAASPADARPPADGTSALSGAFVWTRQEAGGIGVVVTEISYQADMGMIMVNGWLENQGADPVDAKTISMALVAGGRRLGERSPALMGGPKMGSTLPPGERAPFGLNLANVGPLEGDFALEVALPGAAEPLTIIGAPPAPTWPQQGVDVFSALDVQEDAPEGFVIRDAPFSQFDPPSTMTRGGMPQPILLASISLEATDNSGLVAFLMLFGSAEEGLPLYNQTALQEQAELIDGIGDRAVYYAGPTYGGRSEIVEAAFMRCNAVFTVQGTVKDGAAPLGKDDLIEYMRRVDARVEAGCGEDQSGTP